MVNPFTGHFTWKTVSRKPINRTCTSYSFPEVAEMVKLPRLSLSVWKDVLTSRMKAPGNGSLAAPVIVPEMVDCACESVQSRRDDRKKMSLFMIRVNLQTPRAKQPYRTTPYASIIRIRLYGCNLSPFCPGHPSVWVKDRYEQLNIT